MYTELKSSPGFPAISNCLVIGNKACTATILSRPFGNSSCAGVLKPLPNIFDLVILPSCNNVVTSLNPKFHH